MVFRVCLILWVLSELGVPWCLEQPQSSLLEFSKPFQKLCSRFTVFKAPNTIYTPCVCVCHCMSIYAMWHAIVSGLRVAWLLRRRKYEAEFVSTQGVYACLPLYICRVSDRSIEVPNQHSSTATIPSCASYFCLYLKEFSGIPKWLQGPICSLHLINAAAHVRCVQDIWRGRIVQGVRRPRFKALATLSPLVWPGSR